MLRELILKRIPGWPPTERARFALFSAWTLSKPCCSKARADSQKNSCLQTSNRERARLALQLSLEVVFDTSVYLNLAIIQSDVRFGHGHVLCLEQKSKNKTWKNRNHSLCINHNLCPTQWVCSYCTQCSHWPSFVAEAFSFSPLFRYWKSMLGHRRKKWKRWPQNCWDWLLMKGKRPRKLSILLLVSGLVPLMACMYLGMYCIYSFSVEAERYWDGRFARRVASKSATTGEAKLFPCQQSTVMCMYNMYACMHVCCSLLVSIVWLLDPFQGTPSLQMVDLYNMT